MIIPIGPNRPPQKELLHLKNSYTNLHILVHILSLNRKVDKNNVKFFSVLFKASNITLVSMFFTAFIVNAIRKKQVVDKYLYLFVSIRLKKSRFFFNQYIYSTFLNCLKVEKLLFLHFLCFGCKLKLCVTKT